MSVVLANTTSTARLVSSGSVVFAKPSSFVAAMLNDVLIFSPVAMTAVVCPSLSEPPLRARTMCGAVVPTVTSLALYSFSVALFE